MIRTLKRSSDNSVQTYFVGSDNSVLLGNQCDSFSIDHANDYILVKASLDGNTSYEQIMDLSLRFRYSSNTENVMITVTKLSSSFVMPSEASTGYGQIIENAILSATEREALYIPSNEDPEEISGLKIDLTKFLQSSSGDAALNIALSFRADFSKTSLTFYNPRFADPESEDEHIDWEATLADIRGFNGIFKYDEHDLGGCGKLFVNLKTGVPTYYLNVISGIEALSPIAFSIILNEAYSLTSDIPYKLVPTYRYNLTHILGSNSTELFKLEDPSGSSRYYEPFEYTEENKAELAEEYGIKHLDKEGTIYRCTFDHSYMFYEASASTVTIYDKADNSTVFSNDGDLWRIAKTVTPRNHESVYTWENGKLKSISNDDGETLSLDYNSSGYISRIAVASIFREALFTYPSNKVKIELHDKKPLASGEENDEIIRSTTMTFEGDSLVNITNDISGFYLEIERGTDTEKKVLSATLYTSDGSEKNYRTRYEYKESFTRVTDLEGNYLIYRFDRFGRSTNIFDKKDRVVSHEYAVGEENGNYRMVGRSKAQTHSRNLLFNHSFEHNESGAIPGWTKDDDTSFSTEIVHGGMLGQNCLKITSDNNNGSLNQAVNVEERKSLILKGFIKNDVTISDLAKIRIGLNVKYTYSEDTDPNVPSTWEDSETTEEKVCTVDLTNRAWYEIKTDAIIIPTGAERISVNAFISVENVQGSIYIDDLQLTSGDYISRYNYIKNGYADFTDEERNLTDWSFTGVGGVDAYAYVSATELHSSLLGSKAILLPGNDPDTDGSYSSLISRSAYQTIPIYCRSGDHFVYSVFGKCNYSGNSNMIAYIQFGSGENAKVHYFPFPQYISDWQMLTVEAAADKDYTSMTVGVIYDGIEDAYFDCFQLYRDFYGTYYNYDKLGNITEMVNANGASTGAMYNSDNRPVEIRSTDGSIYKYTYYSVGAKKGLLSRIEDIYGNFINFDYDAKERVTSTVTTPIEDPMNPISTSSTYDDAARLHTFVNEFNIESTTSLDYLKRTSAIESGRGYTTNYDYTKRSELERVWMGANSSQRYNSMSYDELDNMSAAQSSNQSAYTFEYDSLGRLTAVKKDSYYLEEYAYDASISGYSRGNLISKRISSSGDAYTFTYDDDNRVTGVSLKGALIAEYTYDENGRVYKFSDKLADEETYYMKLYPKYGG